MPFRKPAATPRLLSADVHACAPISWMLLWACWQTQSGQQSLRRRLLGVTELAEGTAHVRTRMVSCLVCSWPDMAHIHPRMHDSVEVCAPQTAGTGDSRGPEERAASRGQARADFSHAEPYQQGQRGCNDPAPDDLQA